MDKDATAEGPHPEQRPLRLRWAEGQIELDRRITVGQAQDNMVVLRDRTVSRYHCVFESTPHGPILRDLNSRNGTFVSGARIQNARLGGATVISLGTSRLQVVGQEEHSILLGEADNLRRLRDQIAILAGSRLPILILGETGTGKELVARSIHLQSGRRGAFVPLNCGAISKELVESELFGHERGAFTGAAFRREGVFETADEGTLFLDEIGELPASLQSRLLRVLESGVVRPVGASREIPVNVRVLAATHVDLVKAVREGRFRQDLYFRLAAASLTSPPLRARLEDIPQLARHILNELEEELGHLELTEAALAALQKCHWPGNVRELKNVLRRAATLHGPVLDVRDLELSPLSTRPTEDAPGVVLEGRRFTEIERDVLQRAINRCGGNKRAAAQLLQIPKSTLCDKAKRYGL